MEHQRNDPDWGKHKHSDKIVFQCQFFYYKTDINLPAIAPEFLQRKAGD
jgi:hypothetical protein